MPPPPPALGTPRRKQPITCNIASDARPQHWPRRVSPGKIISSLGTRYINTVSSNRNRAINKGSQSPQGWTVKTIDDTQWQSLTTTHARQHLTMAPPTVTQLLGRPSQLASPSPNTLQIPARPRILHVRAATMSSLQPSCCPPATPTIFA